MGIDERGPQEERPPCARRLAAPCQKEIAAAQRQLLPRVAGQAVKSEPLCRLGRERRDPLDVQLAAGDGVVAGGAQTLAHGRRRHPVGDGGQRFSVALLVGLQAAEAVRQVSGEQAVARRHAHRIGRIGQFETGALARQPVQRRRAHVPVAGVSRQPVVLLIGGDQQDVRPRGRRLAAG